MNSSKQIHTLCFLFLVGLPPLCFARELTGTVKTKTGEPIAEVYIVSSNEYKSPQTDSQGKFKIDNPGRVLHFIHQDYRRVTKVIDDAVTSLEIILETQSANDWIAPSCTEPSKDQVEIWGKMYFTPPKDTLYKQGTDVDYQLSVFWYQRNTKGARLEMWVGPHAIAPFPKDEWFIQAKEFTQRTWVCGKRNGEDFKGKAPDGKYWRWTRVFMGAAIYENASAEEAAFFDKIIESMCCGELKFN